MDLTSKSALVIGAGGLSGPALLVLAAGGVGRLVLVEDDVVETSNLNRQPLFAEADLGARKAAAAAHHLRALFPAVAVEARDARFDSANAVELSRAADVVVDGSDNFATKFLANDAALRARVPLVHGGVLRTTAQLLSVTPGGFGGCLRCLFEAQAAAEAARGDGQELRGRPQHAAVDQRHARAERGVVREELRREVVRPVDDDVGRARELDRVRAVEPRVARLDRHRREERAQVVRRRGRLPGAEVRLREERLPVQVRRLDDVVLDEHEPAHAAGREDEERRAAEAARADDQRALRREVHAEARLYPAPRPRATASWRSFPPQITTWRPSAAAFQSAGNVTTRSRTPPSAPGSRPTRRMAVSQATTSRPSSRRASSSVSRSGATRAAAASGGVPSSNRPSVQSLSGSKKSANVTASPSAAAVTARVT